MSGRIIDTARGELGPVAEPVELPALRAELERVTRERDELRVELAGVRADRRALLERARFQAVSGVTKSRWRPIDDETRATMREGFEQRLEARDGRAMLHDVARRGSFLEPDDDRTAPAPVLDAARRQLAGVRVELDGVAQAHGARLQQLEDRVDELERAHVARVMTAAGAELAGRDDVDGTPPPPGGRPAETGGRVRAGDPEAGVGPCCCPSSGAVASCPVHGWGGLDGVA